jgi:hypothetical protein
MTSAQDYRDKAAEVERLAHDPRQGAELRAELRAIGRRWRHWAEQADWHARQPDLGAMKPIKLR